MRYVYQNHFLPIELQFQLSCSFFNANLSSLFLPLCFIKICMAKQILAFLAFGSACSVSGVTTALCDFFDFPTGGECKKYIASNVFMWFTWLVQVIPLVVFTAPAIAKAGDSQDGTVLRTALQTRA